MARTADAERRSELLERVVDYVFAHGLADLSLRPLAAAVDSSPRVLLYYFKSKEALVLEVLQLARLRQRRLFEHVRAGEFASPLDVCRAIWEAMSAPKWEAAFRFSFEVYALALQDRKRFPGVLAGVVADWLAMLEEPALRAGYSPADAAALGTVVVAGFRGFMMDLCATRDRKRVDRAVELWLLALASAQPAYFGLYGNEAGGARGTPAS